MSIIEKLGIKKVYVNQGKYIKDGSTIEPLSPYSEVREVEQQRNELLEAVIGSGITNHWFSIKMQNAVEKADPKHRTWSEIKELL